jgi:TatD DNase family protein
VIDCHAHLACEDFDADRDEVLARAAAAGVEAVLLVGEDQADNDRVLEVCEALAEAPVRCLPCLGFHPDRFGDDRPLPSRAELDAVIAQIRDHAPRLAAIGEVGLDRWYARDEARRRAQEAFLEEVAALAAELDLPLNVHSRSAGKRTLDLLRGVGARRVLMHAFDGKAGHAREAAEDGYLFSVPPSAVRSPQKQRVLRLLPLESLALESDSPVLGPERHTRNEPANLTWSRDEIARIQGVTPEDVVAATGANARRLFPVLTRGRER